MKDIKSMIIGFLLATCMFLMMGQGSNNSQIGKYQISTCYRDNGNWIFETILNTKSGDIVSRSRKGGFTQYKK